MYIAEFDAATAGELSSVKKMSGYFFEETATLAGAARVELRDGSATGTLLDVIILAADGYKPRDFTVPIAARDGIYVLVVSGTVSGCVYGEK